MSVIGREALGEMNIFIITMLIVGMVLYLSYKQAHGELKINPKIRKIGLFVHDCGYSFAA